MTPQFGSVKFVFRLTMRTGTILFSLIAFYFLSGMNVMAQSCDPVRYIDPMFDVTATYGIEYQEARPYGSFFNQPYHLDIYEPEGDTLSARPVVVFQFGGGYLIGDKLFPPAPSYCPMWAELGYVCVSINYRLGFSALNSGSAERAVYRGVQDLQAALRFLCEYSEEYRIDTDKILVTGNSAGAISTLHSTFMEPNQAPTSYQGFGIGLDSYNLGGVFDSGNNYWNNEEVHAAGIICNWGAILDTNFIGDAPDDLVPTIMFHGTEDNVVHYDEGAPFDSPFFPVLLGSEPMNTRFGNTNIPHKFVPLVGAAHEPELLNGAYNDTIVKESTAFMYQHVLQPEIFSVSGNQNPLINSTELYTVTANEPIIHLCVSLNNGTVVSSNLNEFEIGWNATGHDTIQVIAGNSILAYDTILIPVFIDAAIGVQERESIVSAKVYPNPFSDITTIQLNGKIELDSTLTLNDLRGRVAYSKPVASNTIAVSSGEIGNGFFLLQIEDKSGNKRALGKLISQ
ncbi:MAG: carboxylesterase family protein [Flavobacteriales bacterium]